MQVKQEQTFHPIEILITSKSEALVLYDLLNWAGVIAKHRPDHLHLDKDLFHEISIQMFEDFHKIFQEPS